MQPMRMRPMALLLVAALAACQSEETAPTGLPVSEPLASHSTARQYSQIERLANPLVSEVTVVKKRHHIYNIGQPSADVASFTGDVAGFVQNVAGRDAAYASAIAGALLPDMLLIYPKRDGKPVFWLSWVFGGYGGRTLNDDVVDIGLGAIFGTLLGNTNNVTPGLTTDNVPANDKPFGATFPYLAGAS